MLQYIWTNHENYQLYFTHNLLHPCKPHIFEHSWTFTRRIYSRKQNLESKSTSEFMQLTECKNCLIQHISQNRHLLLIMCVGTFHWHTRAICVIWHFILFNMSQLKTSQSTLINFRQDYKNSCFTCIENNVLKQTCKMYKLPSAILQCQCSRIIYFSRQISCKIVLITTTPPSISGNQINVFVYPCILILMCWWSVYK